MKYSRGVVLCLLIVSISSPFEVLAQADETSETAPKPKPPACSLVVKKANKQICTSGRRQWTVCTQGGSIVSQKAGSCVGG